MENLVILFFLPILSGVILLAIEYWVIQPRSKNQPNKPIETNVVNYIHPAPQQLKKDENEFSLLDAFYTLAIGILGGSGGLAAAITIRALADDYYSPNNTDILNGLAELVADSNFVFGIIALFSLVGGVALAFIIDNNITTKPVFWKRVLSAGIFGVVGGFGILILLILGAIILFINEANKGEKQWRKLGDKSDEKE